MNNQKIPTIDNPADNESELIIYLCDCIADWASKNKTDRKELLTAIRFIFTVIFCKYTDFYINDQCNEIDHFCEFLKHFARNEKIK